MSETLTASTRRVRMLAPDLARGFMLLLIALAHAPLLITGIGQTVDTRLPATFTWADQAVNLAMTLLVFSRSFPLFAAMLGYGLVLVIESRRRRGFDDQQVRSLVRRRGRWMLIFGLGMALLVTPIEILGAYGLITLLLAGVLVADDRVLRRAIRVAAGIAVVASVVLGLMFASPSSDAMTVAHLGYGPIDLLTRVITWVISVIMNTTLFPVALAMLVGVWAGRQRLLEEPDRHRGLLRRIIAIGLPVSLLGALPLALLGQGVLPSGATWWAQALHVLTGLAGGFAYAAIFGLLGARIRPTARWTTPLVAIGRRSLTSYIVMEAALVVIMVYLGFGNRVGPAGAAVAGIAAWLVCLIIANGLRALDKPGPADWLLRRLVYRRDQTSATAPSPPTDTSTAEPAGSRTGAAGGERRAS